MANFADVWKKTKGFEGGYQAMPKDTANYCPAPGKPGSTLIGTNHGISAIGYAHYLKRCPTIIEMKNLSEDKAREVAKKQYWDQVQGDKIKSQALGHLIFDITYGSSYGPLHVRQAINDIQGKDTVREYKSFTLSDAEIAQINKIPEKKLFEKIYEKRVNFYKGLPYEAGLTNRLNKLAKSYSDTMGTVAKVANKNIGLIIALIGVIGIGAYLVLRKKK